MAAATTLYDVRIRYMMQDRASKGLDKLSSRADMARRSSMGLTAAIGRAAAAAAGFFGLRAANKSLIQFNSTMEQARIQTAGLLQMTFGGEFNTQLGTANDLVRQLQLRAAKSTATTQEMVGFMKEIVQPVSQAGLKTSELATFTANAVVAAKAFGDEGIAAFDIQQALTENVKIRDRFTRKLLIAAKMTREEFNKLAVGGRERLDVLQRALAAPAIANIGAAQEKSFAGVLSTFQDQLQMFLGKVGLPLFKALTAEVQRWNEWITDNSDKMQAFAKEFGGTIASAFGVIKDIAAFFVNNAGTLLLVAKAFVGLKLGRMAGGLLGGLAGRIQGMFSTLSRGGTTLGQAMSVAASRGTMLANSFGMVLGPLGMLAPVVGSLVKKLFMEDEKVKKARAAAFLKIDPAAALANKLPEMRKRQAELQARKMGGLTGTKEERFAQAQAILGRKVRGGDMEDLAQRFERSRVLSTKEKAEEGRLEHLIGVDTKRMQEMDAALVQLAMDANLFDQNLRVSSGGFQRLRDDLGVNEEQLDAMSTALLNLNKRLTTEEIANIIANTNAPKPAQADQQGTVFKPAPVKVTINRIEVQSDDPDRFVFQLSKTISDARKNPSSAQGTRPQG